MSALALPTGAHGSSHKTKKEGFVSLTTEETDTTNNAKADPVKKSLWQFQQKLKENIASVIKNRQTMTDKTVDDLLTQALIKLLFQHRERIILDRQAILPDQFFLVPMPPDQYCFYHALGQTIELDGLSFFQAIINTAQSLLQDSPELTAIINNFSSGEGAVEEIATMSHIQEVNQGQVSQQVWGHIGLLPFLCWYLELSVVVVTPGTWTHGAGALYFMPDGEWELLGGNAEHIAETLVSLHQDNPELLIMQHNGVDHWDVLAVNPYDAQ